MQVGLVIRGLFICEFAYSKFTFKIYLANSVFVVQNSGTYLTQIRMPTCTYKAVTERLVLQKNFWRMNKRLKGQNQAYGLQSRVYLSLFCSRYERVRGREEELRQSPGRVQLSRHHADQRR